MIADLDPRMSAASIAAARGIRDRLGRPFEDLRVSLTPECNMRCPYCMPASHFPRGYGRETRADLLDFDSIVRVVRAAVPLGLRKVRLTGGEPLLRPDVEKLVAQLATVAGVEDIALSTNGLLLAPRAAGLARAGLQRVNVSLDGITPEVFARMSGGHGKLPAVLSGIRTAQDAGLPVKLNMVVRRGWNDREIIPLAEFARREKLTLRFIEFMDVGMTNNWSREQVVTAREILEALASLAPLRPAPADDEGSTAARYVYADHGEIGIIASVSAPFCRGCRRARLTSNGHFHTCLFSSLGHDLRPFLRSANQDHLIEKLSGIWSERADRYSELRANMHDKSTRPEMSYLGG